MALSTNAAWLRATLSALAGRGFKIAYEPGWETRSNGSLAPDHEAIIVHHTGGIGTSTAYLRDGEKARPMLPPYAQVHVRRDATLVVIAAGGASHAGYVHKPCWDRIIAGTAPLDRDLIPGPDSTTFSANRPGIGVEVNGAGGPADWTAEQRAVVLAFCAEYHRVRGWTVPRVGAHKELTRRKPGDPYEPMGRFRTDLMTALRTTTVPTKEDPFMALTDSEQRRILDAANRVMGGIPAGSAEGRTNPDGKPARILDSADGDYLRQLQIATAEKLGVDVANIRGDLAAQAERFTAAVEAIAAVAASIDDATIRQRLENAIADLRLTASATVTVTPEVQS